MCIQKFGNKNVVSFVRFLPKWLCGDSLEVRASGKLEMKIMNVWDEWKTNSEIYRQMFFKIHFRTHTGEKPYICDVANCGRAFAGSNTLAIHKRTRKNKIFIIRIK